MTSTLLGNRNLQKIGNNARIACVTNVIENVIESYKSDTDADFPQVESFFGLINCFRNFI